MRMDGEQESSNVEDVRGMGSGGGFGFGGRSIGLGSVAVAVIAGWIFGINPLTLLGLMGDGGAPAQQSVPQGSAPPRDDPQARFVSQVLHSTEQVWSDVFRSAGQTYPAPKLVLFRDSWPTACGRGQAAMGPFYCPGDSKVYIDLSFYDVLQRKLGAPGEFAQAYVIAHEVGHHVQHVLGVMEKVDAARSRASERQANALSVRVELQADCFAGVWAARSQQRQGWRLEPGDIESALNAAAQIGDDTLQRKSQGTVVPESFTHGSSEQRVEWFKRGVEGGSIERCNTFERGAL
ncbi:KPN_02809 family neutral zinc metallopeptidase [Piscinibacter koreensis]|uniref:Neutral zinc metallopeptidase n=1 Tax=Piscinibacter koreensis TaxID=2742824 RepID=A0A7Y6NP92_9BURK|nr:neutral zinc metallopeptidase [Schlegelella koreensis]NUZ06837.1 neutral zinc metallopeptidase [Schlegelella koreensis]